MTGAALTPELLPLPLRLAHRRLVAGHALQRAHEGIVQRKGFGESVAG